MEKLQGMLDKHGCVQDCAINFIRKDGTTVQCSVSISLIYNEQQEKIGSLSIIRDLSEWKAVEKRLKYLSFHDSLTELYNRAFSEEETARLTKDSRFPLGLIICDIDRLKENNDTLGHQKGDEMICAVADILRRSFRSSDITARIGGDEFAVLIPNANTEGIEDCIKRVKETTDSCNARYPEDENLSVSIGYAISGKHPVDMKTLFKEADDRMYSQKGKRG